MEDVKVMSIRFPKELHSRLRHRCIDSGTSVNRMVLDAIEKYLERQAADEKASSYL